MNNQSRPSNFWRWFDPRKKKLGTIAFILNRITALGLTLYLGMHLIMLGKLASGQESYDAFIELAKTPLVKMGEMLVVAGVIIHGLNGLRVALTSLGYASNYQKQLFTGVLVLSLALISYFFYFMFFLV